jgi:MFS family permease
MAHKYSIDLKMKPEPNKAMEPTPVNVTSPACAGLAPFTSMARRWPLRKIMKRPLRTCAATLLLTHFCFLFLGLDSEMSASARSFLGIAAAALMSGVVLLIADLAPRKRNNK